MLARLTALVSHRWEAMDIHELSGQLRHTLDTAILEAERLRDLAREIHDQTAEVRQQAVQFLASVEHEAQRRLEHELPELRLQIAQECYAWVSARLHSVNMHPDEREKILEVLNHL